MCCYDRICSVYNGYLTTCKYENCLFLSSVTRLQWILCISSMNSAYAIKCFFAHLCKLCKNVLSTYLLLQPFAVTVTVQLYLQLISICVLDASLAATQEQLTRYSWEMSCRSFCDQFFSFLTLMFVMRGESLNNCSSSPMTLGTC